MFKRSDSFVPEKRFDQQNVDTDLPSPFALRTGTTAAWFGFSISFLNLLKQNLFFSTWQKFGNLDKTNKQRCHVSNNQLISPTG